MLYLRTVLRSVGRSAALGRKPLLLLIAFSIFSFSGLTRADALDGLSVMAVSPADGKVVLKNAEHPMTVMSLGDSIFGSDYLIKQILPNKLLIKDQRNSSIGNVIWAYKAKPGLASRIEKIERVEPEQRLISSPADSGQ